MSAKLPSVCFAVPNLGAEIELKELNLPTFNNYEYTPVILTLW